MASRSRAPTARRLALAQSGLQMLDNIVLLLAINLARSPAEWRLFPSLQIQTPIALSRLPREWSRGGPARLNPSDRAGTNNAMLQGGASCASGEVGSGFFLDGVTGAIDFGNQVGNFGTNDFTIDFWLQTQSTRQEAILSKRVGCYCASFWNIFANGGCIQFEFCHDGSCSIYQNFTESEKKINDGQFHHVAVTRSNVFSTIYVDGSLAAWSTASAVAMLSNNVPCYAAISPCSGVNPFTGVLDGNSGLQPCPVSR